MQCCPVPGFELASNCYQLHLYGVWSLCRGISMWHWTQKESIRGELILLNLTILYNMALDIGQIHCISEYIQDVHSLISASCLENAKPRDITFYEEVKMFSSAQISAWCSLLLTQAHNAVYMAQTRCPCFSVSCLGPSCCASREQSTCLHYSPAWADNATFYTICLKSSCARHHPWKKHLLRESNGQRELPQHPAMIASDKTNCQVIDWILICLISPDLVRCLLRSCLLGPHPVGGS